MFPTQQSLPHQVQVPLVLAFQRQVECNPRMISKTLALHQLITWHWTCVFTTKSNKFVSSRKKSAYRNFLDPASPAMQVLQRNDQTRADACGSIKNCKGMRHQPQFCAHDCRLTLVNRYGKIVLVGEFMMQIWIKGTTNPTSNKRGFISWLHSWLLSLHDGCGSPSSNQSSD